MDLYRSSRLSLDASRAPTATTLKRNIAFKYTPKCMYETHLQQRRTTELENKLSQQMLQHSRYVEKTKC